MRYSRNSSGLYIPQRLAPRRRQRGMFAMGPAFFQSAAAGGVTDPYFAYVTSLNHFDGANGSTTFTDQIGAVAWTANGSSQLSTAQFKFGTSSLYVNGGYATATGIPNVGTGDFTVEGFAYATSLAGNNGLFDTLFSSSIAGMAAGWNGSTFQLYEGGSSLTGGSATTGNWFHWAYCRSGTTVTFYIGGVAVITNTYSGNFGGYSGFTLGAFYNSTVPWTGYIDELRVTTGYCRYTANFTPPTAAFPNS